MLPGSHAVLFTVTYSEFPQWDATDIAVQSLRTGERKILIKGGADARYVPTGHLVYMRTGTLMAVPFNLDKLELTGSPVAVIADVMQASTPHAFRSIRARGSSVCLSRARSSTCPAVYSRLPNDRCSGSIAPEPNVPFPARHEPILPSGSHLMASGSPSTHRIRVTTNVWVSDILRGSVTRLTDDGRS